MKTIVLSDMHNRMACARDLFQKIGLMDEDGERVDGFHVIQLGDLLSLGYGEQEVEFLEWVRPFIDEQLIGNHELPALVHRPDLVKFVGWEDRDIVAEQMVRSEFRQAYTQSEDSNLWKAATHVGKWLITHAGASHMVLSELEVEDKTARAIAHTLNDLFDDMIMTNKIDPIFYHAGASDGGIFWLRLQYLRAGYRSCHIPQIVGHTPYMDKMCPPSIQNKDGNLWAIDTPGSIAALITEDDGETWELIQSDYEYKYGDKRERGKVYVRGTSEIANI